MREHTGCSPTARGDLRSGCIRDDAPYDDVGPKSRDIQNKKEVIANGRKEGFSGKKTDEVKGV